MIKHRYHILHIIVIICLYSMVQADEKNYNYFKYG